MAKRYSDDLRRRVIAWIEEGHTVREAAEKFGVSPSFAAKSHKRHVDGGGLFDEAPPAPEPAKSEPAVDQGVTASDLAEYLGVSKRSISDFAERGLVDKMGRNRFDLRKSVKLYCEHLREVAAGRGGENVDVLAQERARLAREQADHAALRNAAARGELISIAEVKQGWVSIARRIRGAMMSVPSRCRQTLPHLTTFDVDLIDREIREALTELGEIDNDKRDGSIAEGGVGKPDTTPEASTVGMD